MFAVRPFKPADAPGVAALILPIQQQEFGIDINLAAQPDLLQIEQFYQRENGNFWVAEIADVVLGTIGLLDIGQRQLALRKMFVARPYRGREYGMAQALLQTAIAWSQTKYISDIFLGTTERFLAAHRFYQKNHFLEIPRAELPAAFPVMSVDNTFFRLALSELANRV
jgi:GNAT superfamily N-acetyltransferase